jgi:hypothetical protein
MHINRNKYIVYLDTGNIVGCGHGALIEQGGEDFSIVRVLAPSILSFVESHYQRLKSDFYMSKRQLIEGYSNKPLLVKGSVTVTNGIKIEAVAKYLHHLSFFDEEQFDKKYFFAYQIRIYGPSSEDDQVSFDKC